jgi:hypothetical protein
MKVSVLVAPAVIGVLVGGALSPVVTPPWDTPSARSLEAALERGDFPTAMRMAEAVNRGAARDGRWEPLIGAGDVYRRIAGRPGAPEVASKRTRDAYGAALRSARRAESVEGVLRVAEAFAQLGDASEVELSLRIARELAGSDAEATADVKAAAGRLSDLLEASGPEERGGN